MAASFVLRRIGRELLSWYGQYRGVTRGGMLCLVSPKCLVSGTTRDLKAGGHLAKCGDRSSTHVRLSVPCSSLTSLCVRAQIFLGWVFTLIIA